jgi:hypothetical protein
MLKKKGLSIVGLFLFLVFSFAFNVSAETYNYARNPSFERIDGFGRPTLWVYTYMPWVEYYPDESEKVFGERALKIVLGEGDHQYTIQGGVGITPGAWPITVLPNTSYTLSYYIKAEEPDSVRAKLWIEGLDAEKRYVYTYWTLKTLQPGWQRVKHTFTPHDYIRYFRVRAGVTKRYADPDRKIEKQTVWIDGVQFEEGSEATGFTLPTCERETTGVTHGRFADYLLGDDVDKPLRKTDGSIIQAEEVTDLYGTEDGFVIYDGGIDVCSLEYQAKMGNPLPLKPVYQNLSDQAGWPDVYVEPDSVSIDPLLGRFAFFPGDCPNLDGAVLKSRVWTGFGVPGTDIEVKGNYAYIAPGEGNFQILDVSDKLNPQVVGHFAITGNDVTVIGDYAYLSSHAGVYALDISNPLTPRWPASVPKREALWRPADSGRPAEIASSGNLIYVTSRFKDNCFYILDATDPLNLAELGHITIQGGNGSFQLFISGDYAYLGMYNDGVYAGGVAIIDISNPSNPQIAGIYEGEGGSISLYEIPLLGIAPPYLIMSKRALGSRPAELFLVDVSNPSQPVRKGSYILDNNGEVDIFVVLKRAIAESSPESSLIYVTDANRDTLQIGMHQNMPPTRLLTFDISSPDNPQLVNEYIQSDLGKYRYLIQEEDHLFITDGNYGVRIFDVSTPSFPIQLGGVATAAENHFVALSEDGKYAYVTQTFGGTVRVIDISDPGLPTEVGEYWDGDWNTNRQPKTKGNFLYLPHTWGVKTLDVSDPINPSLVGEFGATPLSYGAPDISIFGNHAYVSISERQVNDYHKQIYIYDLTNPGNPIQISSLFLTTSYKQPHPPYLFAQGNYLYAVLYNEKRLYVIDVHDPANPIIIGDLQDDNLDKGTRLYVANDYAYICRLEWGTGKLLHIVDVSDPQNPVYVKLFDIPELPDIAYAPWYRGYLVAEDIKISGRYMYIGSYSNVLIFDISDPINPIYFGDTDLFGFRSQIFMFGWESWGAGWSSGELMGRYLFSPSLDQLNVIQIIRDSQAPQMVTVSANLISDTVAPIVTNVMITPNPAALNTPMNLKARIDDSMTFESPIESAEYNIDGGAFMPMTAEDGIFDTELENVQANINAFQVPGVYNICVHGSDSYGNISQEECVLLAVYDPEGGFVTGGGWIWSPFGAYTADPSLEGKANFGFVSKYTNGASIPTGQTQFQFKVADLNFHSDSYEWLVVAGAKAKYKGVGTINGEGEYRFMLTGIDADINESDNFDVDRFRIKIWIEDGETEDVVYDNALGSEEDLAATEIGGGSIKIHQSN